MKKYICLLLFFISLNSGCSDLKGQDLYIKERRRLELESISSLIEGQKQWNETQKTLRVKIEQIDANKLVALPNVTPPGFVNSPSPTIDPTDKLNDFLPFLEPLGAAGKQLLPLFLGVGAVQ